MRNVGIPVIIIIIIIIVIIVIIIIIITIIVITDGVSTTSASHLHLNRFYFRLIWLQVRENRGSIIIESGNPGLNTLQSHRIQEEKRKNDDRYSSKFKSQISQGLT